MSGGGRGFDYEGYPKLTVVLGMGDGRPLRTSQTSRAGGRIRLEDVEPAREVC